MYLWRSVPGQTSLDTFIHTVVSLHVQHVGHIGLPPIQYCNSRVATMSSMWYIGDVLHIWNLHMSCLRMRVCVCVRVWPCVSAYVPVFPRVTECVRVCSRVTVYVRVSACVRVWQCLTACDRLCLRVSACVRVCRRVSACVLVWPRVGAPVRVRECAYGHTRTHTHTDTHEHIHTRMRTHDMRKFHTWRTWPMWPTYWTWYRRVNYNVVLAETYDLHTGHRSDAWTTILYWWNTYVTYMLDM